MNSYILKRKSYLEIQKFLNENITIYPVNLRLFLNCSYRQAHRILKKVKDEYHLSTTSIDARLFRMYLFGE